MGWAKLKCDLFIAVLIFILHLERDLLAEIQNFRETPTNVMIAEGEDVKLRCAVNNQQGRAQWTKDGFALGFERDVPGYPRYSYEGDEDNGEHILIITGITLQDDGEYQCQVGPTSDTVPIWTAAVVTVIVPPSKVFIVGRQDGSSVEVMSGSPFTLECIAENSRPAATISWFKSGRMLSKDLKEDKQLPGNMRLLSSTRSKLKITPSPDEDGLVFACRASHPAVQPTTGHLVASIALSVLHPPESSVIIGYRDKEELKSGQEKDFVCTTTGGNPRPWVTWYKNDKMVDDSIIYEGKKVINSYRIKLSQNDDGAVLECRVTSDLLKSPISKNFTIQVFYPPSSVKIHGPSFIHKGESFDLECESSSSNPPSSMSWNIDGQEIKPFSTKTAESPDRGSVTNSKIIGFRPIFSGDKLDLNVECLSFNPVFRNAITQTHTILIVNRPMEPVLEGLDGNLIAWKNALISCTSSHGNPPPTIRILKNGVKLKSKTSLKGRITETIAEITVQPSDNHLEVTCQVEHIPSGTFLTVGEQMNVLFPSMGLTGSASPPAVIQGDEVSLACESSSSNPLSNITWMGRGSILNGAIQYNLAGQNGGKKTSSQFKIRATANDDGKNFTCIASNGFEPSSRTNISIKVDHAPIWTKTPLRDVTVIEGKDIKLEVDSSARPMPLRYHWWRNNVAIGFSSMQYVIKDGQLLMKAAKRSQSGNFTVAVENSLGSIKHTFSLQVQYLPENIVSPVSVVVNEDSLAILECTARGSPMPMLSWKKQNETKTLTTSEGKVNLYIKHATRKHTGIYVCLAQNSVGSKYSTPSRLIVKHAPNIISSLKSPMQFYSQKGESVALKCLVRAAPSPTVIWYDPNQNMIRNNSKYNIYGPKLLDSLTLWESILELNMVTDRDYSTYEFEVHNIFGIDKGFVNLLPPLLPESPTRLRLVNVSQDGDAIFTWNNPLQKKKTNVPKYPIISYVIRYWSETHPGYKEIEITDPRTRVGKIYDLVPGIRYSVTVSRKNSQGLSAFADPPLAIEIPGTMGKARPSSGIEENSTILGRSSNKAVVWRVPRLLLMITTLTGTALLALNIAIIVCFVRRRKRHRNISVSSSKSTSVGVYYAHQASPSIDNSNGIRPNSMSPACPATHKKDQSTSQDPMLQPNRLLESKILLPMQEAICHKNATTSIRNPMGVPLHQQSPMGIPLHQQSIPLDLIQCSETSTQAKVTKTEATCVSEGAITSPCNSSDVHSVSNQSNAVPSPINISLCQLEPPSGNNGPNGPKCLVQGVQSNAINYHDLSKYSEKDQEYMRNHRNHHRGNDKSFRTLDNRKNKKDYTNFSTLQRPNPRKSDNMQLNPMEPLYATINIKTSPMHAKLQLSNLGTPATELHNLPFPHAIDSQLVNDAPRYINLTTFQANIGTNPSILGDKQINVIPNQASVDTNQTSVDNSFSKFGNNHSGVFNSNSRLKDDIASGKDKNSPPFLSTRFNSTDELICSNDMNHTCKVGAEHVNK